MPSSRRCPRREPSSRCGCRSLAQPNLDELERHGAFAARDARVARRHGSSARQPADHRRRRHRQDHPARARCSRRHRRSERIVTIEDVAELRIRHPHHVALEARQANLEGAGAIGLARLVREALRMRPDRLVVGECRGEEVRELLAALNTGHDGGAGTLHASGLGDVPARLEALGALAGLDDRALARQVVERDRLRAAPGALAVGRPPARACRPLHAG